MYLKFLWIKKLFNLRTWVDDSELLLELCELRDPVDPCGIVSPNTRHVLLDQLCTE